MRDVLKNLQTNSEMQLVALMAFLGLVMCACVVKQSIDNNAMSKRYAQTVRELQHENETLRAVFKDDIVNREGTQPYIKVMAHFRELGL